MHLYDQTGMISPNVTKEYLQVDSWSVAYPGSTTIITSSYKFTSNQTIYANWVQKILI